MSRNRQGFFGTILLLIRLLITTVFTLAVFALLLGFVAFRCMYPAGSHMLAATLSSYPIVDVLPKIYFSSETLDRILEEQASTKNQEDAQSDDIHTEAAPTMVLGKTNTSKSQFSLDENILFLNGLYVMPKPTEIISAPSEISAQEDSASVSSVLYGCVSGASTAYLRLKPSLDAKKVHSIEPGTWCVVLGKEQQFIKIIYDNSEYFIYHDRLDIFEVPELPEGLAIPGLREASEDEIAQMPHEKNKSSTEEDLRVLHGFVDSITPYRTSPLLSDAQVGSLDAGTHFLILEILDSFYKISVNGTECYVHKEKVTTYYEELTASTQSEAPGLSSDNSTSEN